MNTLWMAFQLQHHKEKTACIVYLVTHNTQVYHFLFCVQMFLFIVCCYYTNQGFVLCFPMKSSQLRQYFSALIYYIISASCGLFSCAHTVSWQLSCPLKLVHPLAGATPQVLPNPLRAPPLPPALRKNFLLLSDQMNLRAALFFLLVHL